MTSYVYLEALDRLAGDQTLDWVSDTIVALLVTEDYTFSDVDTFIADISGHEIAASSYVRKTLTGKSVTQDSTNRRLIFEGTVPTWSPLGGGTNSTIGALVIAKDTGSDATSPLIAAWVGDPILPYTTAGIDFHVAAPGTTGLFYIGA